MGTPKWYTPPKRRLRLGLKFDYHDLRIGLFYTTIDYDEYGKSPRSDISCSVHTFYICIVPMVAIVFEIRRDKEKQGEI